MKERIQYMDTLRGLAVLLMVQQHLQSWLWEVKWISYSFTWPKYPIMLSLHFTGWFAAPLFLILAGAGAAIMHESGTPYSVYIKRGLLIVTCGYLLNFITPNWFDPGSWYVLHTIGFSIIIAPFLNRMGNRHLFVLTILIIIIPVFLQTYLKTSLMPGNDDMNNIYLSGGIFRLIFAEGHFPIFPWLGFFVIGIISRRLVKLHRYNILLFISIILTGTGIFLGSLYNHGYFFATGGKLFRLFVPLQYFYPPLPAFIFFIMGISLLFFYLVSKNYKLFQMNFFAPLNALGRTSLTWFMIHVFIYNQVFWILGFYKIFSANEVIFITLFSITAMLYLSLKWEKHDFLYSLEWFIRKFASIKT